MKKLLRVINPRYVKLKEMWLKLYDKYKSVTKVLTHGDAQPSNFLIIDDHALIVDFEFTANNDPYYDIACFGNIDFADAEALLDVYLDNKTSDEAVKRLIFNRYFQCLQWHLVATYKHNIGLSEQLHIPFDKVSIIYLDKIDVLLKKVQRGIIMIETLLKKPHEKETLQFIEDFLSTSTNQEDNITVNLFKTDVLTTLADFKQAISLLYTLDNEVKFQNSPVIKDTINKKLIDLYIITKQYNKAHIEIEKRRLQLPILKKL